MPRDSKTLGAYFTPEAVAAALVRWAVRNPADLLLDPSSGDGRFIALHPHSVGVERDPASVAEAASRAPHATVVEADFFTWAADDKRRFDCAAGNPPFIRYQRFTGTTRWAALDYCRRLGVTFSGLSSSWAPFIVAAASKLRPGGRIAFVVPAEIGHAPYAVPLVEYLVSHFGTVQHSAFENPAIRAGRKPAAGSGAGSRRRLAHPLARQVASVPAATARSLHLRAHGGGFRRGSTGTDRPGGHRVRQRGQQLLSSAPVRSGALPDT